MKILLVYPEFPDTLTIFGFHFRRVVALHVT